MESSGYPVQVVYFFNTRCITTNFAYYFSE